MKTCSWVHVACAVCCLQIACATSLASDRPDVESLFAKARQLVLGNSIVLHELHCIRVMQTNDLAATWNAEVEVIWKWPEVMSHRVRGNKVPDAAPRNWLSHVHIEPGKFHVVNTNQSLYYTEAVDDLTLLTARQHNWRSPGIYDLLLMAELLAGEIELDWDKQLVGYSVLETERESVVLYEIKLMIPMADYAPGNSWYDPKLPVPVSIWLEEDLVKKTVVPAAMQVSLGPGLSLGSKGGRLVGNTIRQLIWDRVTVNPDIDEEALAFTPPPDAERAKSLAEVLGISVEDEGPQGDPLELLNAPAPPFELPVLDREQRVAIPADGPDTPIVILDFWATWCVPCVRAMPELMALEKEFADRNVHLYAVNVGESADQIRAFLEKRAWNLNVLLDEAREAAIAYRAGAIPQTVIIDHKGIVRHVHIGFDPSRSLQEVLRPVIEELISGQRPD